MKVKFTRSHPDAIIPQYATVGAAGMDLSAHLEDNVTIEPGDRLQVSTGISMAFPPGWEGQVRPRSGLALRFGLTVLNAPGTVDGDYRGGIKVLLVNQGKADVTITPGQRIAQLVIAPVVQAELVEVDELDDTERGAGGFGSTDNPRSGFFVLDADNKPVRASYRQWARFRDDGDAQLLIDSVGDVAVSTIFLGTDHGWDGDVKLFETYVHRADDELELKRYATPEEAMAGHAEAVARLSVDSGITSSASGAAGGLNDALRAGAALARVQEAVQDAKSRDIEVMRNPVARALHDAMKYLEPDHVCFLDGTTAQQMAEWLEVGDERANSFVKDVIGAAVRTVRVRAQQSGPATKPEPAPVTPPPGARAIDVWQEIIESHTGALSAGLLNAMRDRRRMGLAKYGTPLMTNNGRKALADALQEALDLCAYAGQHALEGGADIEKSYLVRGAIDMAQAILNAIDEQPLWDAIKADELPGKHPAL